MDQSHHVWVENPSGLDVRVEIPDGPGPGRPSGTVVFPAKSKMAMSRHVWDLVKGIAHPVRDVDEANRPWVHYGR